MKFGTRRLAFSLAILSSVSLSASAQEIGPRQSPFGRDARSTGQFPDRISKQNAQPGIFGNFTPRGIVVQRVASGSPAERAGVKVGDLIMKMDGRLVQNQQQYQQVVNGSGGMLSLVVGRNPGGQVFRLLVDLRSAGCGRIRAPYVLGVQAVYSFLGATVRKVYDTSPASKVGIRIGDVILRINNRPVRSAQEYYNALYESGGKAIVEVRRGGRTARLNARLELYRFGTLGSYSPLGAQLEVVAPEAPAANAGLKPNDFVMTMDGRKIQNQQAFDAAIDRSGGSVICQVKRAFGGLGRVKVDVVNNSLGTWAEPAGGGMRIVTVNPGSLANRLGMTKGDIIFRIDRTKTQNLRQMQNALDNARGVMSMVMRSRLTGQLVRIRVDLGAGTQ